MFGVGISTTLEASLGWARRKCIKNGRYVKDCQDAVRVIAFDIDVDILKDADTEMVENSFTLNVRTGVNTFIPIIVIRFRQHLRIRQRPLLRQRTS